MTIDFEKNRWEEGILKPSLAKNKERKANFVTSSGIPLPVLPTPLDDDYMEQLGFAGEFPYTRGVQPNMYRGRFWTMRQYAGFASAEESNKRYRFLLQQGQTGLISSV